MAESGLRLRLARAALKGSWTTEHTVETDKDSWQRTVWLLVGYRQSRTQPGEGNICQRIDKEARHATAEMR